MAKCHYCNSKAVLSCALFARRVFGAHRTTIKATTYYNRGARRNRMFKYIAIDCFYIIFLAIISFALPFILNVMRNF